MLSASFRQKESLIFNGTAPLISIVSGTGLSPVPSTLNLTISVVESDFTILFVRTISFPSKSILKLAGKRFRSFLISVQPSDSVNFHMSVLKSISSPLTSTPPAR